MIKNKLSIIATAIIMTTTGLQAFAGINVGIGGGLYESNAPTGVYSDGINELNLTDTLGLEGNSNSYGWAYFEHPIPFIPNIRVELNEDSYNNDILLQKTFLGKTFSNNVNADLDLSSNDLILYWGVPMTGLLSTVTPLIDYDLDFGIGIKQYNGGISINDELGGVSVEEALDAVMPYGYLRARVEGFGVGVEAQVKYTSYLTNSYSDYLVKVDYTIPVIPLLDLGVEAGYKQMNLEVDLTDNVPVKTNLETSGFFVGAFLKF
jgi:outer membrane protein